MTDQDYMDIIRKTQRSVSEHIDYIDGLKFYCGFLASGEEKFSPYIKKNAPADMFGWKNASSFGAGIPQTYRRIRVYLGRDFWKDIVQQKSDDAMQIVPAKKETSFVEFMAYMMSAFADANKKLDALAQAIENHMSVEGATLKKVRKFVETHK